LGGNFPQMLPTCLRAWAEPLPESLLFWAFIFVQAD